MGAMRYPDPADSPWVEDQVRWRATAQERLAPALARVGAQLDAGGPPEATMALSRILAMWPDSWSCSGAPVPDAVPEILGRWAQAVDGPVPVYRTWSDAASQRAVRLISLALSQMPGLDVRAFSGLAAPELRLLAAGRTDVPPDLARRWMLAEDTPGVRSALLGTHPADGTTVSSWITAIGAGVPTTAPPDTEISLPLSASTRVTVHLEPALIAIARRADLADAHLVELYAHRQHAAVTFFPLESTWPHLAARLLLAEGGPAPDSPRAAAELFGAVLDPGALPGQPAGCPTEVVEAVLARWGDWVPPYILQGWVDRNPGAVGTFAPATVARLLAGSSRELRLRILAQRGQDPATAGRPEAASGTRPEERLGTRPAAR